MAETRFRGVTFFMNGRDYVIPSLSLRQLQEHYDLLTKPGKKDENLVAQFAKYLPVIGQAVRRNYPEVTDADLEDWLDISCFREIVLVVQGASGIKAAAPGE